MIPEPVKSDALERGLGISVAHMREVMTKKHGEQPANIQEFLNDMRVTMNTPEGMRVLWVLLDWLGLFKKCYKGNADTYYNLGRHETAMALFGYMTDAEPLIAARIFTMSFLAQKPEQGELADGRATD